MSENIRNKVAKRCMDCPFMSGYPEGCRTKGMQNPEALCFRYRHACNKTVYEYIREEGKEIRKHLRRCHLKNGHLGDHEALITGGFGSEPKKFKWRNDDEYRPKEAENVSR